MSPGGESSAGGETSREVPLNSGRSLPLLGLGTYRAGPGREAVASVLWAFDLGYRLIDTSLAYWNEADVGAAVRLSGLPREQVLLTSKLENVDHGYDATLRACERSLRNLQVDHLDLYLVHWPLPGLRRDTWRALERLQREGLCRDIGVSNYTERHLDELLAQAEVVPAVNQVESHPFLAQHSLLEYCRRHGIAMQAYSPLAKATRLDDPVLTRVAARLGRTTAQVMLRWQVERGVAVIPKSVRREKIEENAALFDFRLGRRDLEELALLDAAMHLDWDPTLLE